MSISNRGNFCPHRFLAMRTMVKNLCRCGKDIRETMNTIFRKEFWRAFRDVIFPESCICCGAGLKRNNGISFCQICLQHVSLIQEPFCTTCGKPFDRSAGESHLCSFCLKKRWFFTRARAVVCYQGPVAAAVKTFKYKGRMYGLETFAALTRQFYMYHPQPEPDMILPVPLHPRRLRKRGFNQSLVLCRKLFSKSKTKINPLVLKRPHWTRPQTGLNGAERRRNVRNAFRVKNPEQITNKRILLVDDVFTTGSTVNECARILLKSKADEVEVFTFARVADR